jgi:hypothetical protein
MPQGQPVMAAGDPEAASLPSRVATGVRKLTI